MNPKTKAIWAAIVSAVTGTISWLANTPPEQQNALLGPLVDLLPITWRPVIGMGMKALSGISGVYATIHATRSGPITISGNVTGSVGSVTTGIVPPTNEHIQTILEKV